jgi:hypothetical protein
VKYLQAGVELTLTSPYKFRNRIDAVADVYFMKARTVLARFLNPSPLRVAGTPVSARLRGFTARA